MSLLLEGAPRHVTLMVQPVDAPDVAGFFLISFHEKGGGDADAPDDPTVNQQAELATSRERLRSAVEEHESYEKVAASRWTLP